MFPHGETVTIQSPVRVPDRYGNDVPDWSAPVETEVSGVAVAPRHEGEERGDGRLGVIVGYSLFLPAGTVVGPLDRIVVRGEVFEVEGEPASWVSPFTGWAPGVEVAVRRVEG